MDGAVLEHLARARPISESAAFYYQLGLAIRAWANVERSPLCWLPSRPAPFAYAIPPQLTCLLPSPRDRKSEQDVLRGNDRSRLSQGKVPRS